LAIWAGSEFIGVGINPNWFGGPFSKGLKELLLVPSKGPFLKEKNFPRGEVTFPIKKPKLPNWVHFFIKFKLRKWKGFGNDRVYGFSQETTTGWKCP